MPVNRETHRTIAASTASLPVPDQDARRHSLALVDNIGRAMDDAGGSIDFARFMDLCLYAPDLGYYASGLQKFGAAGDFVTAPEIGELFGRCLARQCAEVLGETGGNILEAGAGSGRLAVTLLRELETLGCLPGEYEILDVSPHLRAMQRERIDALPRHLGQRVRWTGGLPAEGFRGVMVANELLDALPAIRFQTEAEGGFSELHVTRNGDAFAWAMCPPETAVAQTLAGRIAPLRLPPGYVSELGLRGEAWVRTAIAGIERGVLLLVDYGFPRHEFYHPQRAGGTLMCHYRHRVHADPLVLPGLQDLSVHVDFTAIAETAQAGGCELLGFTTQAAFLLSLDVLGMLDADHEVSARERLARAREAKLLTLPSEMGELFKIMAVGRGVATPLAGFRLQDHRGRL